MTLAIHAKSVIHRALKLVFEPLLEATKTSPDEVDPPLYSVDVEDAIEYLNYRPMDPTHAYYTKICIEALAARSAYAHPATPAPGEAGPVEAAYAEYYRTNLQKGPNGHVWLNSTSVSAFNAGYSAALRATVEAERLRAERDAWKANAEALAAVIRRHKLVAYISQGVLATHEALMKGGA